MAIRPECLTVDSRGQPPGRLLHHYHRDHFFFFLFGGPPRFEKESAGQFLRTSD